MLKYHAKALKLIDAVPILARDVSNIIAVEDRLGRQLPASLREWYSLDGACDMLLRYSNGDPPVAIANLGRDGLIARELLTIRHENQGVCTWAVLLDGSEDPPVVVDYDVDFKTRQPCANSFSDYVYSCFWDWGLVLNSPRVQAQNGPISPEALDFLRGNFAAELETYGWPGDTQYRFFTPDQRILIWESKQQADWWLSADSDDALVRLVARLWRVDDLGTSLWASDDADEYILQRARSQLS